MREESIREARRILIERVLQSKIRREDKIEIAIMLHHLLQEEDYKKNKKALQKVKRANYR